MSITDGWDLGAHIESLGMTPEEYDAKRGNFKYLSKNGKPTNLHPNQIGGLSDPEINAKAVATRIKNAEERKKRKEAAATGFGLSKLADPDSQALLINKLYAMALDDDVKIAMQAMKMLSDMGVTKQPAEKPEVDEPTKTENMSIEDSVSILMRAQKDAADG